MTRRSSGADARAREVGTVLNVTPSGQLTLRSLGRTFPAEGRTIRDRTGKPLGRVTRVFGPVDRPYFSVRPIRPPTIAEAAAWIGMSVLEEGRHTDATG